MRALFVITAAFIIFSSVVGFTPKLGGYALSISHSIKDDYVSKRDGITDFVLSYINQSDKIRDLQVSVRKLEELQIRYHALMSEFDALYRLMDIGGGGYDGVDARLSRVMSYAGFASYTKVWLDYGTEDVSDDKIYGLVKGNIVMGIAKKHHSRLLGMLNGDPECSYGVYIGESKIPGIARFGDSQMLVDYIPSWMSVRDGDEVVTSGLDGVFYSDIKVGRISNVRLENGYIKAKLIPYADNLDLSYVWIVDTKIPQTMILHHNVSPDSAYPY